MPPDGGRPPGPTVRRAGGGTPVARRARPTGGDGTAQNATALVGTVGAVVGGAVLLRAYGSGAAVLAGLVALLALPGCAVMAWVRTTTVLTRVLGVLSASLTWSILACTALAATTSLTRGTVAAVTLVPTVIGCAGYLIVHRDRWSGERPRRRSGTSAWEPSLLARRRGEPGRAPRDGTTATLLVVPVLVAAELLWSYALSQARDTPVDAYGLTPMLGISFVVAVCLTIAGQLWALSRNARAASAVALGLLVLMLNASPALTARTPLATWSYKHFGIVDYIVHGGRLDNGLDVFQQWPGFFSAAAGLVAVSGRSPLGYANWAQPLFELLNTLVVFALANRLAPRNPAVPHLAALLFVTSGWVGQRYYAPQTAAFLMALLLLYHALPLMDPSRTRLKALWERRRRGMHAWYAQPSWAGWPARLIGERRALLLGAGVTAQFAALIVTHQLTPYMAFANLAGLWVIGVLPRPRLVIACGLLLLGSSMWHRGAITQMPWLTVFQFGNLTGVNMGDESSPAHQLGKFLARPIGLATWAFAVLCILTYRRRFASIALPSVLALAPFSLIMMQSYGGEAIYRVFLFSSAWCAMVIAMRITDLTRLHITRWVGIGIWAAATGFGSIQAASFGMYPIFVSTGGEITASTYFLTNAPRGATMVLATPNFASRLNRFYVDHNGPATVNDPSLDQNRDLLGAGLAAATPHDLAVEVDRLAAGDGYLVVSPSIIAADDYFGFYRHGSLRALVPRLRASPDFAVWYDRDGVVILEATPRR